MATTCPVCQTDAAFRIEAHDDRDDIRCLACGDFAVGGDLRRTLRTLIDGDKRRAALLSHMLRRMQMSNERPVLTAEVAAKILATEKLPTPEVQGDNLIRWLGDNTEPGQTREMLPALYRGIIGATVDEGVYFVVNGLKETGLLVTPADLPQDPGHYLRRQARLEACLTFKGWKRHEELRTGAPSGKMAFMAMKFGVPALDAFVDNHLRQAVRSTGFELKRVDDTPKAGLIDDRMRAEIRACRFLIADLTYASNGAYWEAGYAEGLGKPVIYTCEKSAFEKDSHFDTNHHLTVRWEDGKLAEAAQDLVNTIRATIPEASRAP